MVRAPSSSRVETTTPPAPSIAGPQISTPELTAQRLRTQLPRRCRGHRSAAPRSQAAYPGRDVGRLAAGGKPDRCGGVAVGHQRRLGQDHDVQIQVADGADQQGVARRARGSSITHARHDRVRSGHRASALRPSTVQSGGNNTFVQQIVISSRVAEALGDGAPVVALESTIITHGLPHPENVHAAIEFEQTVRAAVPCPPRSQ